MANLRTAIDSGFWDQNLSSPQTLEGTARSVPGEPFPLDRARASRAHRIQQLSLLGLGFPLGIIPSLAPAASDKHIGSFSLHSLLLKPSTSNWWLGLVGQFRPKKLVSDVKAELSNAEEWELPVFRDAAKHILDKSLYSIGLWSQFSMGSSSSLMLSTERHGDKKGRRNKLMFFHQLPNHDITLEAAWPELFIDHKGRYWDVAESVSLDLSSLASDSGLRYRFGIHKNSGHPRAVSAVDGDAPSALMPGLCGKAAFSYQMSKDFWRQKETKDDVVVKTDNGTSYLPSYDVRLREPHAALSGIIGGNFAAWFRSRGKGLQTEENMSISAAEKRSPLSADLFGSVCYTFQHGKFRKLYGDLTRVDARIDICSASVLAKRIFGALRSCSAAGADNSLSSPRLNLIFQQQVAGPIVFRVDSQMRVESGKHVGVLEDVIYSLNYSLRLLGSGKVVAWYSPKRKEGMIELRVFEF